MLSKTRYLKIILAVSILAVWIYWDFNQADVKREKISYHSYKILSDFDTVSSAVTKVAIVRSDDDQLPDPIPITDENITYDQIESMVRRAIQLAGGLDLVVQSGDTVLLKPNIVDPEPPGTGEVTDVRVIKALIKIIDEIDPGNIEIVVGEGSPRPMDYEMDYQSKFSSPQWDKLWDVAGYQDLLNDTCLDGINFRLSNLNGSPPENPWQDLVEVEIPNGGQALPQGGKYYIHKDVLNADVYITVPVMKIHRPGITVALKNQIGLAPSTIYGFSKTEGVPQKSYQYKLIHESDAPKWWTDKEIVDLSQLAQIKFVVVDALACLERVKEAERSNGDITNLVRMNCIIAGVDPVAVDHVCTRLMGLNPDDIEHITLAERIGLGTNNPDNIEIVGAELDQTSKRFIKSPSNPGDFGQSNRIWLLNGPYNIGSIDDPINHSFINDEAEVTPVPEENGWSPAIYFTDDRIDLADFFNDPDDVISYAFTYFNAPADQQAELWIGSDEAMKIYINGIEVYHYTGTRSFNDNEFYTSKILVNINQGENRLLVKTLQRHNRYDFSLNICEPEADPDFDGNRIWGLKFYPESGNPVNITSNKILSTETFQLYSNYPNPFNKVTVIPYYLGQPGKVAITIFNISGKVINKIFVGWQHAGPHRFIWDGYNTNGRRVAGGIYFYRLQVNGQYISRKMIMIN